MRKSVLFAVVLFSGLLVTGAVFLATWDIPSPAGSIEKVLPDDRFPR